jgi:hypothetical protein
VRGLLGDLLAFLSGEDPCLRRPVIFQAGQLISSVESLAQADRISFEDDDAQDDLDAAFDVGLGRPKAKCRCIWAGQKWRGHVGTRDDGRVTPNGRAPPSWSLLE